MATKKTNNGKKKTSAAARKTPAKATGRKPVPKKTTQTTQKVTGKKVAPSVPSQSARQVDNKIFQEAAILVILGLSIIFMIANFGIGGTVGDAISSFFFGMMGYLAYIFPILLFFGTIFGISNKNNSVARIKILTGIVTLVFFCGLLQLIQGADADLNSYADYYTNSSIDRNGGGYFGGLLAKTFVTWFGTLGAYVFTLVFIIIGIVVISERSFLNGIRSGSSKVYHTAKSDMETYKEEVAYRRQEKENIRLRRVEKKVKGVAYDTEIPRDKEFDGEDIHEISPNDLIGEPLYHFEEAKPLETDEERYGDLPYYEETVRHFEEEQSSPFENTIEEEVLPDYLDMELIRKEMEREADPVEEVVLPDAEPSETASATKRESENQAEPIQPAIKKKKKAKYLFPPLSLLKMGAPKGPLGSKEDLRGTAAKLQQTLANFGVKVTVTDVSCGPSVTRYEIQPEQGVKVSKIVSLADDIKLNLAAADIRIEAPIPGKAAVGIEVPNKETSGVFLGDLLSSQEFKKNTSPIAFAAGKDIGGQTMIADIAKMPHLLIAGATGSGKSVCINTIIMSILYRANPEDVKLIMIDPKVVELSVYNGIPHLMIPVVTDPKKAAGALNWAVAEMTDRYQKFAQYGVRDIQGYNDRVESIEEIEDQDKPQKLPKIVIIVDELADLMMVSSNEVEDAIVRLAQLARAAGLHLVIATQRPSVNVITGLIKANVPSRIAFSVSSGVDSRTIIDMNGAEKLLGKGDMLFYPQGYQKPLRVQGAFVSDEEVSAVVDFLKANYEATEYDEDRKNRMTNPGFAESQTFGGDRDQYFAEAGRFIIEKERASIGMLQRIYKIGFNRAARIMDQLCEAGVVGPEEGTKPRKVLMTMEEFTDYLNSN